MIGTVVSTQITPEIQKRLSDAGIDLTTVTSENLQAKLQEAADELFKSWKAQRQANFRQFLADHPNLVNSTARNTLHANEDVTVQIIGVEKEYAFVHVREQAKDGTKSPEYLISYKYLGDIQPP